MRDHLPDGRTHSPANFARTHSVDHVQIDEFQDTNGPQFRLVEALVRRHRNLCVVGKINDLVQHERVRADDVGILFRPNEQPRLFETEFRRVQLPYVLIGGQSFFDRREIRDMLADLKVLHRPNDETSAPRGPWTI